MHVQFVVPKLGYGCDSRHNSRLSSWDDSSTLDSQVPLNDCRTGIACGALQCNPTVHLPRPTDCLMASESVLMKIHFL